MQGRSEWMVATDEAILAELVEERIDYAPLIAGRRGIHVAYAEERCRRLEEHGLIERVSDEVVYRITERGEQLLDA